MQIKTTMRYHFTPVKITIINKTSNNKCQGGCGEKEISFTAGGNVNLYIVKCPLIEVWIKKMWYIHTMEYYSAMRKDEVLPFVTTWMDFETIVLSKISQSEKLRTVRGL